MTKWILTLLLAVTVGGPDAKQLAQKGHSVFLEVLGGDETKLPEALKNMEDSRDLDPTNSDNLYNLSRVYFYDAIMNNKPESAVKAEQTLAKLMEVNPAETRAVAFHGSVLTFMSGGKDIAMFMKGAQEMMTSVAKDPKNINNHIVLALTSENFPKQALAAMGNYDNLKDLEFVRDAFDGQAFYYAPHADAVMKAFVAEAYKVRGDEKMARLNFEASLAVPQPAKAGERSGREKIDAAIRARMNGDDKPLGSTLMGCHACHLNR